MTTAFVRRPASWYGYFLIATQIYLFNVQGKIGQPREVQTAPFQIVL